MSNAEHWDFQPDGNIATCPFLGWEIGMTPTFALVRLTYGRIQGQHDIGAEALQLTMTPVQLRSLGEVLLRTASTIDAQHLGTRQ